ncbi:MAG TPA: hypothetical protein VNT79_11065 [Phycisphaerae bacterium]|nr:hypothetical protein [Phycisphaerae bacterium]
MLTGSDARQLIQALKRQLILSGAVRILLLAVIAVGVLATAWLARDDARLGLIWAAAALAGLTWIGLAVLSLRQMRAANQATVYMANGRLDLAENQLISAANQFSLYRQGKLLACHNLAVVAHGLRNFEAAANLCDGVVAMKGRPTQLIGRTSRILLADCRLSLGDAAAANRALAPLTQEISRLSLDDQLLILPIELRSKIAMNDFAGATSDLKEKVARAELLDSPRAAMAHALMAVACLRTGDAEKAGFLLRRARLYHDLTELTEQAPGLRELLEPVTSADNN